MYLNVLECRNVCLFMCLFTNNIHLLFALPNSRMKPQHIFKHVYTNTRKHAHDVRMENFKTTTIAAYVCVCVCLFCWLCQRPTV